MELRCGRDGIKQNDGGDGKNQNNGDAECWRSW